MATKRRDWYRLDNAATIYPAATRLQNTHVFRVAATLDAPIDPAALDLALKKTLPRFPTFAVMLHRGVFWNYLEANHEPPGVQREERWPCSMMEPGENRGYCFRVLYFERRIALETYHVLADGTGAIAFLKSLIYHYLSAFHDDIAYDETVLNAHIPMVSEELEDAFHRYADDGEKKGERVQHEAYHIGGLLLDSERLQVIHASAPLSVVLAAAKAQDATLTELLSAAFAASIAQAYHPKATGLPLRVQIPVNLRRFFPSRTLRNFSSYIDAEVAPDADFPTALATIRSELREGLQRDAMLARFSPNVEAQRNFFMRAAPLPLKTMVLKQAFHRYGERQMTASISNLGPIVLPPSMAAHVESFDFILPSSAWHPVNLAVCSYGDTLFLAFSRVIEETEIERLCCRMLAGMGIPLCVWNNGEEVLP